VKTIVAKNGCEYTIPEIVDDLSQFQTGNSAAARNSDESFSFVPSEVGIDYKFGPFRSWLYKKDEDRRPLICIDYGGKTIYMSWDIFQFAAITRAATSASLTACVFPEFCNAVHGYPFYSTKPTERDSYKHDELRSLGFVSLASENRFKTLHQQTIGVFNWDGQPRYPQSSVWIDKTDYVNVARVEAEDLLREEGVIKDSWYNAERYSFREFPGNLEFEKLVGVSVKDFVREFYYHSIYMCTLWTKEKSKIRRELLKNKAESQGMTVREFQKQKKQEQLELKSIERTSKVLEAAPGLISFKEHLNLFMDKLSKGEKFSHKEVQAIRKLLKKADQNLLDIRYMGKY
jgi:hypothetical protein